MDRSLASSQLVRLIADLREEVGTAHGSLSEIARRTGLAHSYIRAIESGELGDVRPVTIDRLCRTMALLPKYFETEGGSFRDFLRSPEGEEELGPWEPPLTLVYELRDAATRFVDAERSQSAFVLDRARELATIVLRATERYAVLDEQRRAMDEARDTLLREHPTWPAHKLEEQAYAMVKRARPELFQHVGWRVPNGFIDRST